MRCKKSHIAVMSATVLTTLLISVPALAGQWQQGDGGRWWYNNLDNTCIKSEWAWIDGDSDGIAECYYFDAEGWLITSTSIDGKRLDSSGKWVNESGEAYTKSSSENGVYTNGASETSTGIIELGSDMELGTEWELETAVYTANTLVYTGKPNVIESHTELPYSEEAPGEGAPGQGTDSAYSGPGTGGVNVLSVGAAPGKTLGSAILASTSKSSKGSAEAYTGNVGTSSDSMPRSSSTELVEYARSFIGVLKYKTAGASLETGTDCSGFTQQIFKSFGINIPRDSRSQYAMSEKISVEDLRAGDLIFYGKTPQSIYHVGIYTGNGTIVHSTHSGDYVREHDAFYSQPYGYGRYYG